MNNTGKHGRGPAVEEFRVQTFHDGVVTATATVSPSPAAKGTTTVSIQAPRAGAPPRTRSDLVDAVMDMPDVTNSRHVHVVMQRGDAETITRLRERTTNLSAHVAGSSSIIDADIAPANSPKE